MPGHSFGPLPRTLNIFDFLNSDQLPDLQGTFEIDLLPQIKGAVVFSSSCPFKYEADFKGMVVDGGSKAKIKFRSLDCTEIFQVNVDADYLRALRHFCSALRNVDWSRDDNFFLDDVITVCDLALEAFPEQERLCAEAAARNAEKHAQRADSAAPLRMQLS